MTAGSEGKYCGHHGDERKDGDGPAHAWHAQSPKYREESRGALTWVLSITCLVMVVELAAGILTHSLALMADAGHMLSDVAAQLLALLAIWFAAKPPTPGKTYGYYRTEILASLINGVALVGISLFILFEGVSRLAHPPEIASGPMLGVAMLGLIVNLLSMKLLHQHTEHSLNIKAAYLEVLGDLLGSIGVIAAAIIIMIWHFYLADPVVSMLIGVMILPRTWRLLSECTNILMEGTPEHIDLDNLHGAICQVEGVLDVHDIHVWTITSGLDAMSGHLCIDRNSPPEKVLAEVTRIAQEEFGLHHTTIQVELADHK